MLFAFTGKDKPGALQVRIDTRPAHVAFLEKLNAEGTLKIAGPFLDEEGKPSGSLVVIEAADKKAAEAILGEDPYAKAGLFASTEIRQWNWTFNKPEGI
ncbi:YciI-like protein [Mesorhizobium sp. BAC0120]|uniref:YciI-like protein n=1 Tax=Mesorhizobium sp. BAC0120 TaxID=3090670 RepID=UPI00298D4FD8|nr:YciI-like protein [Mesorhizobium sp. BAC0120]MDW6022123.1 YciI-like protein [Mesorhizobium sp. BAC0120]